MANSKITIDMQVQVANRELGLRHAVYPKRVGNGLMSQEEANHEIDAMRAILETLREVKKQTADLPLFR